jgi:hypothetical protein
MPNYSHPDDTPASRRREGPWAIPIPLRVSGIPLLIVGRRPSWHWTIHYMAYAGVTRLELASAHTPSIITCIVAYVGCFWSAMITGTLVRHLKADRSPRIFSTTLGLAGFTFACMRSHTVNHQQPAHHLAELVIPLVGAGLAFAVNVAGEALTTWFPASERHRSQAQWIGRFGDGPGYDPVPALGNPQPTWLAGTTRLARCEVHSWLPGPRSPRRCSGDRDTGW